MVSKLMIGLGVVVLIIVLAGAMGFIRFDSPTGGVPVQVPSTPAGTVQFSGQLRVDVTHTDSLDNSEIRVEGVDIETVYYKSSDGTQFASIGSGTGVELSITRDMNSVMYATLGVLDPFFIDPMGTANQALNARITDWSFIDVTNNGIKEFLFKFDLRSMPPATAGQTSSTMAFFTNSWDIGTFTLNSPANLTAIGTGAGSQNFVRWEITQPQETASAQFEYELRIDNIEDQKWDRSLSTLDIPNVGVKSLTEFDEQLTSTEIVYRFKIGSGNAQFDSANYVTTPQNGNEVIPSALKFVTNLATSDDICITYNIKSLSQTGGTNPTVTDQVCVQEA